MKLAVSNIAWRVNDRLEAYALLERHGITGLEIAPGLFFHGAADPFVPEEELAHAAASEIRPAGLRVVSMQSLLFGVHGAALFGSPDERLRFDTAIRRAIDLAARIDVPNLVFGSPLQRIVPEGMSTMQAEEIALVAFRALGDAARLSGCTIAIEPNSAIYGTNFLIRTREALAFVASVDHPSIGLNLDVGALLMNDEFEDLETLVEAAAGRIAHVHISEPYLAPAPKRTQPTARVLKAVGSSGYEGWFSIEMKTVDEPSLATLDRSLDRLASAVEAARL